MHQIIGTILLIGGAFLFAQPKIGVRIMDKLAVIFYRTDKND